MKNTLKAMIVLLLIPVTIIGYIIGIVWMMFLTGYDNGYDHMYDWIGEFRDFLFDSQLRAHGIHFAKHDDKNSDDDDNDGDDDADGDNNINSSRSNGAD